jgi:hypothetical protein
MTHTFRHPKYYKEMRAKRRKLQASKPYQINYDDFCKGDEEEPQASSSKRQASSNKLQASSSKLIKKIPNSIKPAQSFKRQA